MLAGCGLRLHFKYLILFEFFSVQQTEHPLKRWPSHARGKLSVFKCSKIKTNEAVAVLL